MIVEATVISHASLLSIRSSNSSPTRHRLSRRDMALVRRRQALALDTRRYIFG
jgi:hypothetical protein